MKIIPHDLIFTVHIQSIVCATVDRKYLEYFITISRVLGMYYFGFFEIFLFEQSKSLRKMPNAFVKIENRVN